MNKTIAIVGLGCRYPDADSPRSLWENALAARRAFRAIPTERLALADYAKESVGEADSTYVKQAAVLEGWEFDRIKFRVSGDAYRSTDLSHWLALEVAAAALHDAGFSDAQGLPLAPHRSAAGQ